MSIAKLSPAPMPVLAIYLAIVVGMRWRWAYRWRWIVLMRKYGDRDIVRRIMKGLIWLGATEEMIRDSWGTPYSESSDGSELRYGKTGRNRYRHRVAFRNGTVSAWTDKNGA
ncbi:hypothetical protein [Achromobacter marplatensis]